MRHYEIAAAGALPYFEDDPADAPALTLAHWPKKLLSELRSWPGVHGENRTVDASRLDAGGRYAAAAAGLLRYVRARLTTAALAAYVLETLGKSAAKNVVVLSADPTPDYLRETVVHGFRKRLGERAVDFVKPPHLYEPAAGSHEAPFDVDERSTLYGHGFTYAYRLADDPRVDRSDIEGKLRRRFFDVVVYAFVSPRG